MKRKNRKSSQKRRKVQRRKRSRINRVKGGTRKPRLTRKRKPTLPNKPSDPRIAEALGIMRREGVSASVAARRVGIKLHTFVRGSGRALYRPGPGKPWKVRDEDELAFSMTIITSQGPITVVVRNSRERKLLHRYEYALRMFRAGEDGAEAALKTFDGKTVGGHKFITDTKLLTQLEEAGLLDFENLYASFGDPES